MGEREGAMACLPFLEGTKCSLTQEKCRGWLRKSEGKGMGHRQIKPKCNATANIAASVEERKLWAASLKESCDKFLDWEKNGLGKETDGDGNTTVNNQTSGQSCHKIKVCQIGTEKYSGRGSLHRHLRGPPGIALRNMLQGYVIVSWSTWQALASSSVLRFHFWELGP